MKTGGGRRTLVRVLLASLLALVIAFAWLVELAYRVSPDGTEISLDRVYRLSDSGQILSAELRDEDALVTGEVCSLPVVRDTSRTTGTTGDFQLRAPEPRCPGKVAAFRAPYPRSDVATQQLIDRIAARAKVVVDKQTPKAVAKLVLTFVLPLLLLANLFGLIFLSRTGDGSIAEIAGFGRIARRRQRQRQPATGVTFADVAGVDDAVAELAEVCEYLQDPKKFEAYGAAAPKGVLLFGPPGCGKTLLARAVAGTSGVPFLSISGAEFVESLVGVGAARVRDLFRQVRDVAPAIVFIDEIDAVGRRREGEGVSGGEREQTVNQLLVEMDGFEVTAGIVVMAATNRPDILDPALMRPGRFDRHVTLSPPDVGGRERILAIHARGKPLAADVDIEIVAQATPGFTGADLANVINEAALLAIREGGGAAVSQAHLSEAIQRVLHGPQRRGRLMTAEERKRLAHHESGHALVAAALGQTRDVQRVSIVARARGLASASMAQGERVLLTRSEMEVQLAMAMGGVAAEELAFGESSSTAQDDLVRATEIARTMVGAYGMSPEIGRVALLRGGDGFLGEDATVLDSVSGQTMVDIDREIRRLITAAEQRATALLTAHRDHLDAMATRLEAEETLEGQNLQRLLARVGPEMNLFGTDPGSTASNGGTRSRRPSPRARG